MLHVPNHALIELYMLNHGTKSNGNTSFYRGANRLVSSLQYRYNCQGHYTLFYKKKLCKNKQADWLKKTKSKLRIFRGWEVQTQKNTATIIYISFKNLLTKK